MSIIVKRNTVLLIVFAFFALLNFLGCEERIEGNRSTGGESYHISQRPFSPDNWFKFRGDLRNTGLNSRVSGARKPLLKWKVKARHEIMSSSVFTDKNEALISSHDGNLYLIKCNGEMSVILQTEETLISTPLHINGSTFIGGFDGFFYCLDDRFNVKYKFRTGNWIASSASFLNDGSVLFASNDGYLYNLDDKGRLKWKFFTGSQDYEIHSSPGVYNNTIILGSGQGSVYGIDSDGKMLWRFDTLSPVFASPAIDEKGNIYIGSEDGIFYSLDINGNRRWKYQGEGGITSSAAITIDGSIVTGTKKGSIICLNDGGELKWKFETSSPIESSPCSDGDGNIYIGSDDGKMRSFDSNGALLWEFSTGKPILSSPALNNSGELVFGCEDKFVYCLKAGSKMKVKF